MRTAEGRDVWVRATARLRERDRRLLRLTVGSQLAASALALLAGAPALPSARAWQDLVLAAAFAWSARSTSVVANGRVWPETYPVSQFGAVVLVVVAQLVEPGGLAASGLPLVLLLAASAWYLRPLATAVVVAACCCGSFTAVVVRGPGAGALERWAGLVLVLAAVVALVRHVQTDRQLVRELVRAEATDPVTGLPNERYLEQAVPARFERADEESPLAVVALEVDDLRRLDEEHGPKVTDAVLAALAGRLAEALGDRAVLTAVRGHRFVALLDATDEILAWQAVASLQAAAARAVEGLPPVTVSAGVAVHPSCRWPDADGLDAQPPRSGRRLVREAEEALTRGRPVTAGTARLG